VASTQPSSEKQASYSAKASAKANAILSPKFRPLSSSHNSTFYVAQSKSPRKQSPTKSGGGGESGGARTASARGSPSWSQRGADTPTSATPNKPRPQSAARLGSGGRVGGVGSLSVSAHQLGGHVKGEDVGGRARNVQNETWAGGKDLGTARPKSPSSHWLSASPQRLSPSTRSPPRGGRAASPVSKGPPILTRSDTVEYTGLFRRG
jgi:hypothetical protein